MGVAGLAMLLVAAHLALNWRSEQALSRLEADVETRERLADARVRGEALRQAELTEAAARSVARSKLDRELARLAAARAAVAELRDARRRLDDARASLLDGEVGRAVAADESLLGRAEAAFAAAGELPGTPPGEAAERLDGLSDPLRAAQSHLPADYAPTPALSREIDAVARETRQRAVAVAAEADLWQSLAAEIGEPPSGGVSLRVALDRRRRERDARAAQVRAESVAAARREDEDQSTRAAIETNRTIAAAEREAAKLVGAQLAESIIIEAKKKAADIAAANKIAADQAKQEALEREFAADRAAVSRYLAAFTADGDQYRGRNAPAAKGPASLMALRGMSALDDSELGLRQLLFALHPGNNGRSGLDWAALLTHLPPANWSDGQRSHVQETQRLLRKYGELMVEKGLLAP
ncbi:hypothetical protein [Alienimonas chondri]|nr:hypothetical protein [Alienimonas chondri]